MTATPNTAALQACEICHGERQVKVGWHPVNNIKIKIEYDPCPNCTSGPHSFHAKQTAEHIRAIYARDRALAAPAPSDKIAEAARVVTVKAAQLKAISLALAKVTGRDAADEAALDSLAAEIRALRALAAAIRSRGVAG